MTETRYMPPHSRFFAVKLVGVEVEIHEHDSIEFLLLLEPWANTAAQYGWHGWVITDVDRATGLIIVSTEQIPQDLDWLFAMCNELPADRQSAKKRDKAS